MNIYLTGAGGQGIGLLSEVILRALDKAGLQVKGVDTHGLAQRGGVVVSQIRTGQGEFSPLIQAGQADMVLALERHEALRATNGYLRENGTLVYYDAVWQPYHVRNGSIPEISTETLHNECSKRRINVFRVCRDDLPNPRMQNMALLSVILNNELIPGIAHQHIEAAMKELLTAEALNANMKILNSTQY
jgi:indolepyruvate ferredoxin oxidoreductase beta subunit